MDCKNTLVKKIFKASNGTKMVRFSAVRRGKNLVWPLDKVLGCLKVSSIDVGEVLLIHIEKNRVVKVSSANNGGNRASDHTISPYDFISLNAEKAISDKPVFHDGSSGGELLSGEILCSLEALTPLLVGNDRYKVENADRTKLVSWGFSGLPPKKQIAEPLRLADGRVVLAGSSLKGMIRQSISVLLSAPMERVGERHFTYRPNLDFTSSRAKYEVRPALVRRKRDGGWGVEIFEDARSAEFRGRCPKGYRGVKYKGGMDGEGIMARAFRSHARTYTKAYVPSQGTYTLHIPADLYKRYRDDQNQVLANDRTGHLTAHPLKDLLDVANVKRAIKDHMKLEVGQLIYVEVDTNNRCEVTDRSRVLSFGHHFRYRWAYSSTIKKKGGKPRPCLVPTDKEQNCDGDGVPEELTGARLMFGYVKDANTPIGDNAFKRLAGRIAINHAVSDGVPDFLGDSVRGYCVSLPILGRPKPSAVEFYIQQDGKNNTPLKTYGDLPGKEGGDLAGRKYYLHQPSVQTKDDIEVQEALSSKQATLARFICKPETGFKFAIRFARLRKWELGALLVALEPGKLLGNNGTYAHKLGLGRPIGMGSVKINIDKMSIRQEKDVCLPKEDNRDVYEAKAITALNEKLDDSGIDICPWLDMHEFVYKGQLGYPRKNNNIFDWHTDIRRKYSKLRREQNPDWSRFRKTIKKAKS